MTVQEEGNAATYSAMMGPWKTVTIYTGEGNVSFEESKKVADQRQKELCNSSGTISSVLPIEGCTKQTYDFALYEEYLGREVKRGVSKGVHKKSGSQLFDGLNTQ